VLVDVWAASAGATGTAETPSNEAPILRLLLLVLGIVLTWLFYVLAARLVLWRLGDGVDSV
jgi:F0F1-type ATP synthase membrane subunit c/vacuolar-type H+-ATPase subunit K